jgi:hypothetical protein
MGRTWYKGRRRETATMTPQPLDPRKSPWKRGDVCTRGSETAGFVLSYTSEYLEVRWNGHDGIEKVPTHEIDDILRVAYADGVSPSGHGTNLESLEAIEALERIRNAATNRTFKTDRERSAADDLVRRSSATDGCAWDKKNSNRLLTLALHPETVGVIFKLHERLHRLLCSRFRKKQPREQRGRAVKQPPSAQTFDLRKLRQDLAETNPEVYQTELEPVLDRLDAEYGSNVPVAEMEGLRELISSKIAGIEEQRQEIINRGAKESKTIEIESLRRTLEASKAAYTGPDRNAYVVEMDKLLESLTARYGSRIPVDHAYKIMQDLETGLGYTPDE